MLFENLYFVRKTVSNTRSSSVKSQLSCSRLDQVFNWHCPIGLNRICQRILHQVSRYIVYGVKLWADWAIRGGLQLGRE